MDVNNGDGSEDAGGDDNDDDDDIGTGVIVAIVAVIGVVGAMAAFYAYTKQCSGSSSRRPSNAVVGKEDIGAAKNISSSAFAGSNPMAKPRPVGV